MEIEERFQKLESEIEEIKKDLGTKTESPRGFMARSEERPDQPITVNIACRGISKPQILDGKLFNGWYYQIYNTFYHCGENEHIRGEMVIDVLFTDKNEIAGCRPFTIKVKDMEWKYEYDSALD